MIWGEQGSPEAPSLLPQLYFGSRIIPVSILGPHHAHPGAQSAFHAVRGRDGRGREGRRVNGLHRRATGVEGRGPLPGGRGPPAACPRALGWPGPCRPPGAGHTVGSPASGPGRSCVRWGEPPHCLRSRDHPGLPNITGGNWLGLGLRSPPGPEAASLRTYLSPPFPPSL